MTPEELDDIERRARVNGKIRPERALALVAEVRRLRALTVDDAARELGRCDGLLTA